MSAGKRMVGSDGKVRILSSGKAQVGTVGDPCCCGGGGGDSICYFALIGSPCPEATCCTTMTVDLGGLGTHTLSYDSDSCQWVSDDGFDVSAGCYDSLGAPDWLSRWRVIALGSVVWVSTLSTDPSGYTACPPSGTYYNVFDSTTITVTCTP